MTQRASRAAAESLHRRISEGAPMLGIGRLRAVRWCGCGLSQGSALALVALLLLLHGVYSITPDLAPVPRNLAFLSGSVLLVLLLGGYWLFWRVLFADDRPPARADAPDLPDALFPALMLASAAYFSLPNRLVLAVVPPFVLVQAVFLSRGRLRLSLLCTGVVLLVALVVAVALISFDHVGADMLPVIAWADRVFLHGLNPYFEDYTSVTPGPFFYLPLQWLIYLPLVALHLDLRLLNLAAVLGTAGLYLLVWRDIPRPWTGLAVLLAVIASRPSTEMVYQGEVWPLWFMVSAFAVAFHRHRLRLAAALLGLLLACNQTTLVLAALVGVYQLRSGAWRETLLLGAIVAVVYAAIVFPFAHGVVAFINQYYIVVPRLGGIMTERAFHNSITQMSLVNVLTRLGLLALRGPLQLAAGLVGMAVVALRRRTTSQEFLAVCALTYLVAIGLNVVVWKYYYIQGIVLLFWSVYAPVGTVPSASATARPASA